MTSEAREIQGNGGPAWEPFLRPATGVDAPHLVNIYREVYKGTYSYKEYVDVKYLKKEISHNLRPWYIIQDRLAGGEVVGCISGAIDARHGRTYVRGMMLRPSWQGLGGTSILMGEVFQDFLAKKNCSIKILWSENRATNVKPQLVAENVGFQPLGILPFKDVFYNKREGPVLMAIYSTKAWENRINKISLIPEVLAIKKAVGRNFPAMKHDEVTVAEDRIIKKPSSSAVVDISIFDKKFGYTTYVFTCLKTGESIEIIVNNQCLNAEGLSIHCTSPVTLKALLAMMMGYLDQKGIHYIEGHCRVTNTGFQKAFIGAGFKPFGYLPAWEETAGGTRVDKIIFGWTRTDPQKAQIALTRKSKKLFSALFE
ncbi:MAG: GNAT family N-acetyltransferase [Promethearchaeota archaeon]